MNASNKNPAKLLKRREFYGLIVLLTSFVLFFFVFKAKIEFSQKNIAEKFSYLWIQDLNRLKEKKVLPPAWHAIRRVELEIFHPELKGKITSPIILNSDGKYLLKVLILPWKAKTDTGVVIQYDLYEEDTNLWVWEIARNFYL